LPYLVVALYGVPEGCGVARCVEGLKRNGSALHRFAAG